MVGRGVHAAVREDCVRFGLEAAVVPQRHIPRPLVGWAKGVRRRRKKKGKSDNAERNQNDYSLPFIP